METKQEMEKVYVRPTWSPEEQAKVIKEVVTNTKVTRVDAQSHYTKIPGTYGYTEVASIYVETKDKFITIEFVEANVMINTFENELGFTLDYHRNYGGTEVYVFVKHKEE
ncbi:MAG: hypothetical protein QXI09_03540 [Candidatus Aenigmatarchaeota archaeon]